MPDSTSNTATNEEEPTTQHTDEEVSADLARERAKERAKERALARAEEDARIDATGRDEWHYIQNDVQYGPVPLAELKSKASDLSISPPIKYAWHEGMEAWKPVYEIPKVCGVSPLAATQCFKLPPRARKPGESEAGDA